MATDDDKPDLAKRGTLAGLLAGLTVAITAPSAMAKMLAQDAPSEAKDNARNLIFKAIDESNPGKLREPATAASCDTIINETACTSYQVFLGKRGPLQVLFVVDRSAKTLAIFEGVKERGGMYSLSEAKEFGAHARGNTNLDVAQIFAHARQLVDSSNKSMAQGSGRARGA